MLNNKTEQQPTKKEREMSVYQKSIRLAAIGLMAAGVAGAPSGVKADQSVDDLRSMLEAQQQQINLLRTALEKTRRNADAAAKQADQAAAVAKDGKSLFGDKITIGGVAEVEVTDTESFAGANTSDITLATVEAYVDAQWHEYLGTHVQFIYEDDGTETISLDEATFMLGNTEKFPVYLSGGKWPMPFGGAFDTAMSSDPLTKSFGEVKEAALLVGATQDGATIEGYFYNGDTQKTGEGDNIDQFGLNAGYGGEVNGVGFNLGVGYINNIGDSDEVNAALTGATALNDYVGGLDLHGDVAYGGFVFRANYMKALDSFQTGELAFNGQGAQPVVWTTEASYTTEILGKETTFAGTVQGTKEALALSYPELRIGGAVTVGIVDRFAVTAEYLHDEDYGTSDGGTGNTGHTATLKLAAEY